MNKKIECLMAWIEANEIKNKIDYKKLKLKC